MTQEILEILYHDKHLVAINKPSGLLVHRSLIDARETRFAIQMTRDQIGQRVYPVHRLDKPTSGVLLFALNKNMARELTEQFAQRTVTKKYLAIVRGYTDTHGVIDYALKEKLDNITDKDANQHKEAQKAVTHYQRLAQVELPYPVGRYETARYSLVELTPKTGRKHQLRRHLKHIYHPIVGDTTHGDGKQNQLFRRQFNSQRLLLHARMLQVWHPSKQHTLSVYAPLPADFSLDAFFD